MARPSKPVELIRGGLRKSEIEARKKTEASLITGYDLKEMPEVKNSPAAHKEFLRLKRLLASINKDDDLFGSVINIFCLLVAEISELEDMKKNLNKDLIEFDPVRASYDGVSITEQIKIKSSLRRMIFESDKQIMANRTLMLNIGKENLLTINSASRCVPKKPVEKVLSPMAKLLARGRPK